MDGTYACSYTPVKAIKHTIAVVWGGIIPHSPYRVGYEVESWSWYEKAPSWGRSGLHAWRSRQIHGNTMLGVPWKMAWPKGLGAVRLPPRITFTQLMVSLLGPHGEELDHNFFLPVLSRSASDRVAIPRRSKCLGQEWREVDWRHRAYSLHRGLYWGWRRWRGLHPVRSLLLLGKEVLFCNGSKGNELWTEKQSTWIDDCSSNECLSQFGGEIFANPPFLLQKPWFEYHPFLRLLTGKFPAAFLWCELELEVIAWDVLFLVNQC